ncbi:Autophagy-related protein 11 [Sphaceloma murrayae]|uniref:Autophagy-related protein 11 n=1 Tax=Sphaceloma murrayae TaxID=2082308 RepID=A0A2K1R203_9PEZI|nr:Autophagy-related protein 11 [Sphaceloma murrayae]
MHLLWIVSAVASLAVAGPVKRTWTPDNTSCSDALAAQGLAKLASSEYGNSSASKCNIFTAARRKEWHTLSGKEKKSYIAAVKCLQSAPSKIGDSIPGAKTRYDDFVAIHIQQTLSIHGTGNFLSWHRYFTWAYEQALRNECGYTGYQPYLNWAKLASNPRIAPVFDGSDTSMSGDGAPRDHPPALIPNKATPFISLPIGNGGDCVTAGPFKDFAVNLGPVPDPVLPYAPANPQTDGLGYNPRCLRRDISSAASASLTDRNVTDLIKNSADVLTFQNNMQGNFPAGLIGVHTAGHFLVGGDPGGDLFASPGDPYFFLQHGQIDRIWWTWQNQDLATRERAVAGTLTLFNSPPSRDTALTDEINLGVLASTVTIGDVMSTTKGPLCYIYV